MSALATPARRYEKPRTVLQRALADAEQRTLHELELVREPLRAAVEAAITGDQGLVEEVDAQAAEFDRRHGEVHDRLLALIARQAPVASDLRLAMALLHVNERVERMGAQCLNIATLAGELPDGVRPGSRQLECLRAMSKLADMQIGEAARVFAERDVDGLRRLRELDSSINQHNRSCFALAIDQGDGEARREAALFVAMMARAIERIGDNTVDIGRQTAFVVTGRLRSPLADHRRNGT